MSVVIVLLLKPLYSPFLPHRRMHPDTGKPLETTALYTVFSRASRRLLSGSALKQASSVFLIRPVNM